MLRNAAQTLPPPAQMLNCLLMHQSWAWEVCCLGFAHPCSAEKSLHIHSLCIQSLNACPDSPWSHMLPPTRVQRVWAPGNAVPSTHRCLFLFFCINWVHSSVSRHNLMEQDLHPQSPHTHAHIFVHVSQLYPSCLCMSVCSDRQPVHSPHSQESTSLGACVCVFVQTHGHVSTSPGAQ